MNYDEMITFLAIVECSSIAKAASQLYISQGTASTRLQHLEAELGVKLFHRQKGIKEVILTPEGKRFLSIARQWRSLYREASQLQFLGAHRELRISAVDTLNRFLFTDAYKAFLDKYPDIQLTVQTEHSTETHQLIESQQMDIGFVFSLHNFPNVVAKPLYRENMVFLYHKDCPFARTRNIEDLRSEWELYASYSHEFTLWHKRRFPNDQEKRITLGTSSMLPDFITRENSWSIVTESIAGNLIRQFPNLTCCAIDDPPPARIAYILTHKYPLPWVREVADLFMEEAIPVIRKNPFLTLLYSA